MSLLAAIKPTPPVKPLFNVGANLDLFSGTYLTGKYGDSLINGGLDHITGATGPGNCYKSTGMQYQQLTVLNRYIGSLGTAFCSEGTLQLTRLIGLSQHSCKRLIDDGVLIDETKFILTGSRIYDGSEYYALTKEIGYKRLEDKGRGMVDTPFVNPKDGEFIKIYPPIINLIDSFSMFHAKSMQKIQDEDIGDSSRNMEAMRDGHAKTQMLVELPTVCGKCSMHYILTAHLGDKYQLNPMERPRKKLSFLQANLTIKNVTEKFTFVTNNLWYFINAVPSYNNTTDKKPRFPRSPQDTEREDKDLVEISVVNLRPKSAAGGVVFTLFASQRDGVLPYVTNYGLIHDYSFGVGGNNTTWHLDLYPEVNCTRPMLRTRLEEDPKFARAMELTAELCQYYIINPDLPENMRPTTKDLYISLKEKGWDWDRILTNTRSYWTFDHYTNPIRPITALDLLNMHAGVYEPWWWKLEPGQAPK